MLSDWVAGAFAAKATGDSRTTDRTQAARMLFKTLIPNKKGALSSALFSIT
jgi:hypothetical protein